MSPDNMLFCTYLQPSDSIKSERQRSSKCLGNLIIENNLLKHESKHNAGVAIILMVYGA